MSVAQIADKLLREAELLAALARGGIILTGRMLRHYVVKELLPTPSRIPGQGNVLFYDATSIERVKVIHQLVREGESLDSIKKILSSAQASVGEILD